MYPDPLAHRADYFAQTAKYSEATVRPVASAQQHGHAIGIQYFLWHQHSVFVAGSNLSSKQTTDLSPPSGYFSLLLLAEKSPGYSLYGEPGQTMGSFDHFLKKLGIKAIHQEENW